jgi:hypothetical protein
MGWLRIFRSSREFQSGRSSGQTGCASTKTQAIEVRICVSKLWTLERPQVGVCAHSLSVGRLWSDARVFDRPARHPLSERSFFLSFLLSFFRFLWCSVRPCMHSCFLCACVRGAWLSVACCARSPGRVLRLRCEGGNLNPFGLSKGARRALVPALHFALVITKVLHLSRKKIRKRTYYGAQRAFLCSGMFACADSRGPPLELVSLRRGGRGAL